MYLGRKTPLVNNQIYHVFNRGIDKRTTFVDQGDYGRFYQCLKFYQYSEPPLNLSRFLIIGDEKRKDYLEESWGDKCVTIYAYCLMPNHFHLILRQDIDNGISWFIGQVLNSYTRYFNTKNKRVGQLFLESFKNVLVDGEEQFLHLSRYIHLNPYTSKFVKTFDELDKYEWSSYQEYLGKSDDNICNTSDILFHFGNNSEAYKKFILDRAEYQRELKECEE